MHFKKYLLIILMLLPMEAFSIYDILSIDIKPTESDVQFCFNPNYPKARGNTYVAALMSNEILFISKSLEGFEVNPWQAEIEPPFYIASRAESSCLGPFPKAAMQGIQVYTGIGTSVGEMVENARFAKIFAGSFPTLPQPSKSWTVMVYIVGSDLEESRSHHASTDILEMLQGTRHATSSAVNVVVTTGGARRFGWQTVKRSLIQNGHQHVLEELSDTDMANPQTLSDFVLFAQTNFPAQHYALILWDHGGGTGGFGLDTTTDNLLGLVDLQQAYQTIREQIGPLDIVVYDACLMAAIEVAEITALVANAMAASVELEPGHGIDYAHLLSHVGQSSPVDGIDFGKVVKTGYIEHTKKKGTFEKSQITYSVFDLTQLESFSETFKDFAVEFKKVLEEPSFLDYKRLSRGIIRAPGYPFKQAGRLRSLDNDNIRIDLYSILQTVGPGFPEFKAYADELLAIIDKMVVDYEGNIADIDPNAGRVSLDIGSDKSYLAALPEAYTLISEGFDFYNSLKKNDSSAPSVDFECFRGHICAEARWLELSAKKVLGVEAYFGQKYADISTTYLIYPDFYQYQELTETLELSVDGHQACQYQLCVSDSQCEDITLTKQGNQLLADISLNDSPAVLSFCNSDDKWLACGVVQQIDGVWGRDDVLYSEDRIVPSTLLMQASETEQRQGNALIVDDPALVILKKTCDEDKAAIWAMYYSFSLKQQSQIEILCDRGDCICKPDDNNFGCKEIGFRAGVYILSTTNKGN
jgi:NAD(P)-dependent dehydrogenase (short-subunit alcohol dehydrogenase family)